MPQLIGTWDGTHIINISSYPAEEVAFIEGSFSTHRDVKTYGDFMYIGTEANMPDPYLLEDNDYYILPQGIQVVDISDPLNPFVVGFLPTPTESATWRDMKVYKDNVYIVADGANMHGVQVFDLTQ